MRTRRPTRRPRSNEFAFTTPDPAAPRRRGRVRWFRVSFVVLLLALIGIASAMFGLMTAVAQDLPALEQFSVPQPEQIGTIYARDGRKWVPISTLRNERSRKIVAPTGISKPMRDAIISVEDRRFLQHRGFDPSGILRAVSRRFLSGTQEGGSTITQQLVKNAFVGQERTVRRKIREIALAYQLEREWSDKQRILASYLNLIYFGNGCYGIDTASRYYFGVGADKLDIADSATLAGIVRSPTTYDPIKSPEKMLERRNLVIGLMAKEGYISVPAAEVAKRKDLLPDIKRDGFKATRSEFPYFVDYVVEQLKNAYGADRTFGGGFKVYTTLDIQRQRQAEASVRRGLNGVGPDGALVSIEPASGEVKAIVAGRDYYGKEKYAKYDLATTARRQPGSSFKPFVLLTALEEGIQTNSYFLSSKALLNDGSPTGWYVRNDFPVYEGPIPLRHALATSDNTVFARLTMAVKPRRVASMAKRLGVVTGLNPVASIGLGGEAVHPIEMAHAYATILNKGQRVGGSILFHTAGSGITEPSLDPISILRIEVPQPDGKVRVIKNTPRRVQVVPEHDALATIQAMRDVVTDGTGKRAAVPGHDVVGKTGTTSNFYDAWFVGGTPQIATAVWVGYADPPRPMESEFEGKEVMGGTIPAQIFSDFTGKALRGQPSRSWPAPDYIDTVITTVDSRNFRLTGPRCPHAQEVVLRAERVPATRSACASFGVVVPNLEGLNRRQAKSLATGAQMLFQWEAVPAKPGQRIGVVVDQVPAPGENAARLANLRASITVKRPTVIVPKASSTSRIKVGLETAGDPTPCSRLQADHRRRRHPARERAGGDRDVADTAGRRASAHRGAGHAVRRRRDGRSLRPGPPGRPREGGGGGAQTPRTEVASGPAWWRRPTWKRQGVRGRLPARLEGSPRDGGPSRRARRHVDRVGVDESPGRVDVPGDPDPWRCHDSAAFAFEQREGRLEHGATVVHLRNAEGGADPAGTATPVALPDSRPPQGDPFGPHRGLDRSDQDRRSDPLLLAGEVAAPVDPVRAVDVDRPRRSEHAAVPPGPPAIGVRGRVILCVGLGLDDHATDLVQQEHAADQPPGDLGRRSSDERVRQKRAGTLSAARARRGRRAGAPSMSSRIARSVRDATTGSGMPSTHTRVRWPPPRPSPPVIGSIITIRSERTNLPWPRGIILIVRDMR